MNKKYSWIFCFIFTGIFLPDITLGSNSDTAYRFDDEANHEAMEHPEWFKQSFYDLNEDIQEAKEQGKKGIILFIGASNCSYCKIFYSKTLAAPEIHDRVRSSFDMIGIDLFSSNEVTDLDGKIYPASQFVYHKKAYFSPTLIFYDLKGNEVLKIVGYYPPNRFSKVLDYVLYKEYEHTNLSSYLADHESTITKTQHKMPKDIMFSHIRTNFSTESRSDKKPLLILLERENCEACNRFHNNILSDPVVRKLLTGFDLAQINVEDRMTKILTPDGKQLTPHKWVMQLKLQYTPAFLFFDEFGEMVLRNESDIQLFRFKRMLEHVRDKVYLREKQFNRWFADDIRKGKLTLKKSH